MAGDGELAEEFLADEEVARFEVYHAPLETIAAHRSVRLPVMLWCVLISISMFALVAAGVADGEADCLGSGR